MTITGTPGWEAFMNRKPVIMFGNYFYQTAPNVFKISNQGDLIEAITKILNGRAKTTEVMIHAYLNALDRCTFQGWVDNRYSSFVDYSPKENNENIAKQLIDNLAIDEQ